MNPDAAFPFRYVGIPFVPCGRSFDGVDCWGLVCLVYWHHFNIFLPDYVESYGTDLNPSTLAELLTEGRANPAWSPVDGAAQKADVLLFRTSGLPFHVGLAVSPSKMLHATMGADSVVERFDSSLWRNRLIGVFRHEQMQ